MGDKSEKVWVLQTISMGDEGNRTDAQFQAVFRTKDAVKRWASESEKGEPSHFDGPMVKRFESEDRMVWRTKYLDYKTDEPVYDLPEILAEKEMVHE